MANATNSRPATPVVVVRSQELGGISLVLLVPAIVASVLLNGGLMVVLYFIFQSLPNHATAMESVKEETVVNAEPVDKNANKDPFLTADIDPAAQEPDTDIQFRNDRKAEVSVPGRELPNEAVGIKDAPMDIPPTNLPAPGGFGDRGQGGSIEKELGNTNVPGMLGGYGPRGLPLAGSFYGRSGATREWALRDGGGTKESEAAVTRALVWLIKHQQSDGRWRLDDKRFPDKGKDDDIAGTAFGLLPFLGAGKTHKSAKDNPYDKPVEKALLYLVRKQDKRSGYFGGGMYAHALATIAMCEAYGLTQDPHFRKPAQMAINFIVQLQHDGGGWRYYTNLSQAERGDTSVVGWVVMALKSAQMAGLDVPPNTTRKALSFLDSVCDEGGDEGYGYQTPTDRKGDPTLSAAGLLCRQYLQSWGPQNLRMIKGVENHVKGRVPTLKQMYYCYYATQVLHHFGGQAWTEWNDKMRNSLVKEQETTGPMAGSWTSEGATFIGAKEGGRLMQTSLCLLTLEVYYRHLPLYRDIGDRKVATQR